MYSTGDAVVAAINTVTWCIGHVVSSTIEHGQRRVRIRVTDPCDAPGVHIGDIVDVAQWRVEPDTPQLILPTEANQALRGHAFYPTATELRAIPDIAPPATSTRARSSFTCTTSHRSGTGGSPK